MKRKLFIETVRSYRISDSEILIREKLMIFVPNIVYVMLSFWWFLSIKCKDNEKQ